ncbi:endolytic transglycosylase MltG [Paenibacillus silvae]|uniref:Endolytic transglycosylase MltG n=1 Tax=Paenibacillus silvae TaxID=1325358 RepID=A0A2W6NJE4_9BACL|nr:endolytic transglycosylase MltG [Paenibacillus silvae]PZT56037.1 hypothetical protein DN757_09700 [Paenibacillus silvae]
MDKRSLWIGIGSGMMIGAILLQLATVGQKALSDTNLEPAQSANWTKEQIESAAKSMDMKLVSAEDELYTEAEWVQKKKQESSQMQGKTASTPNQTSSAVQPAQPQEPKSDNVKGQSEIKLPNTTEPEEPSQPKGTSVTFKVRSGNSLAMVAENLKQAGIVNDAAAFVKAGRAEGINRKIQVGTYSLEKGESFKSIIAKITKEPSN